jgi:hypothetical protein
MSTEPYTIKSTRDVNEEGSTFATVTITFANGEVIEESFASWFDEPTPSAVEQAASFVAAFEESERYTLEERLGPFGLEWQREQEERGGW